MEEQATETDRLIRSDKTIGHVNTDSENNKLTSNKVSAPIEHGEDMSRVSADFTDSKEIEKYNPWNDVILKNWVANKYGSAPSLSYSAETRNPAKRTENHEHATMQIIQDNNFELTDSSSDCKDCENLKSAVKNGHIECVEKLLSENAVNVNQKDDVGATLFTRALLYFDVCNKEERSKICQLLVRHGANVNDSLNDGRTPLQIASGRGRRELAELMLEKKADVNKADKNGWTPIFEAVWGNQLKMCELLLKNKARVDHKTGHGLTPLLLASMKGHPELLRLLYQHGANLFARMSDFNEGMTALMLAVCYNDKNGKLMETVQLLYELGANVNERDDEGMTALMHAARKDDTNMVKKLLTLRAAKNLQDKMGFTALHWAAVKGTSSAAYAILVQEKVDENIRNHKGRQAMNYKDDEMSHASSSKEDQRDIHYRKYDRQQIWDKIAEGHVRMDEADTNTLLHYCAELGYVELFRKLISEKKIAVNHKNSNGMTAVALAAMRGQTHAVERLLKLYDADITAVENEKKTALHLAAQNNKADVIRILLECSALDINARDNRGNTALHCAASNLNTEAFNMLLAKSEIGVIAECDGVSVNGPVLLDGESSGDGVPRGRVSNSKSCPAFCSDTKCTTETHVNRKFISNNEGWTPFHCVIGSLLSANMVDECKTLLQCLKEPRYTVDVNEIDKKGRNLLHLAVEKRNVDIIPLLNMLDPEQLNADGLSPLHMAALGTDEPGDSPVCMLSTLVRVFYSMNRGRDIDHLSSEGESALMLCLKLGSIHKAKLLLNNRSVLSRTSPDGATVFHKLVECVDTDKQLKLYRLISEKLVPWYCFCFEPDSLHNAEKHHQLYKKAVLELLWKPLYTDGKLSNSRGVVKQICAPQYAARLGSFDLLKAFMDTSDITVSRCHSDIEVKDEKGHLFGNELSRVVVELIVHADEVKTATLLQEKPFYDMVWSYRALYKAMYAVMLIIHVTDMIFFSTTVSHRYDREECHFGVKNVSETTDANAYIACHTFEPWFWLFMIWPSINLALDFVHCVVIGVFEARHYRRSTTQSSQSCCMGKIIDTAQRHAIYGKMKKYLFAWLFSFAFWVTMVIWIVTMKTNILTDWYIESSALVLFFGWMYTINFVCVFFNSLAILLDVITTIVFNDVTRISGIFGIMLLSFALPFHLLTLRRSHLNNNVVSIWFTMYVIFFQAFGADSDYQQISTEYELSDIDIVLFRLLFVLYTFIASVVLLNLLIAMMSDSYTTAVESATQSIAVKNLEMSRYAIYMNTLIRCVTSKTFGHKI